MEQIDQLCDLLTEETRVCAALSGVLREEQAAVVRLEPASILVCLEQRQALQDRLLRLAGERRALVRAVAACHGATTERATDVLPLLAPAPRSRVRDGLRQLRQALLEARGLERQHTFLVGSSLDTVNELLRVLRAHAPGARYGADAQVTMPPAADRVSHRA
ncbi:MAG TPA: flagellar protein FlgN [Candidatus Binatia bacterium]|nr:flagellar protein FlgN [Candidatus Binatia bacterium]